MLIGISAKIGHGKDTVGQMIVELLGENQFGQRYEIKKFAGKLKHITSLMTGCTLEQLEDPIKKNDLIGPQWGDLTYRKFMILLGTEAMREVIHANAWVNALFSTYMAGLLWIITDVRFPNEAQAIQERNGFLIRVIRPGVPSLDHISETALDEYRFHYTIVNDGDLNDLREKVKQMLYYFELLP